MSKVYSLRSKYAHTLESIQRHLKIPQVAGYDVFRWENEPFLTFNGLLRLLTHALINFIKNQPEAGRENIDWLRELPSVVMMRLSPEQYIFNPETVSADNVRSRLEGFLSLLNVSVLTGESRIADLRPVLERLCVLYPQANAGTPSLQRAIQAIIDGAECTNPYETIFPPILVAPTPAT